MAETTNWLEICKRQFSNLRVVEGSGPLAVIRLCNSSIVLCQLPIEAGSVAETDCCKNCARHVPSYHRIVELKQTPAPTAKQFRWRAEMQRD